LLVVGEGFPIAREFAGGGDQSQGKTGDVEVKTFWVFDVVAGGEVVLLNLFERKLLALR